MRSETVTIVLDSEADEVFEFLSRVDNLPEWATEFARELRWEDGEAIVRNGMGEFVFRIEADRRTRVIDMLAGPTAEDLSVFPTRVVAVSPESSAFTFTMFQGPGMPDTLFESQHASLERELEGLKARFARAA